MTRGGGTVLTGDCSSLKLLQCLNFQLHEIKLIFARPATLLFVERLLYLLLCCEIWIRGEFSASRAEERGTVCGLIMIICSNLSSVSGKHLVPPEY